MGKRIILAAVSTFLICILVSCLGVRETASINPDTSASTATSNEQVSYSIETAVISKGRIHIEYPQITGLNDKEKEDLINVLIKDDIWQKSVQSTVDYYESDGCESGVIDEITLDLKYQVAMSSDKLLSVFYTGEGMLDGGMHGTSEIYTITVNLENAKKLQLSDFTVVDSELVRKIKQSKDITNEAVKEGMSKYGLIGEINDRDDQEIIEGLRLEDNLGFYTFYVTPDALVVSVPVSHASGDYALITLPGDYTKAII